MELQLYNYFRSGPSYRVRIALHLKNLEFNYQAVHLLNNGGEQNSAEYQKINPAREVPALVHEGQVITQSVAIIEYLDESFPEPRLYPREPGQRARVRQYCENINCTHPLQNLKVLNYLESKFTADNEQKKAWVNQWMSQGFEALEAMVKTTSGQFCIGDHVSAADIFLVPQIFSSTRFNVDISRFKLLSQIYANCLGHEAFQKAHPYRQIDTPAEFKNAVLI